MTVNILLAVSCLSGWLILSRCHQYHFVNQSLNWFEAASYCRQNHTGLANIGNTEEMTQLIQTVSSAGYNSQVWIGVYFHLDWGWSSQLNSDLWKWEDQTANEPFLVYYQCGTALVDGWRCSNCSVEHPFICYTGTPQNPQYAFVNVSMDWFRALRYCRENFTDLPQALLSSSEFHTLVPNGTQAWTGYIALPHIFWIDGTDSSFRYWDDPKRMSAMVGSLYGVADLQRSGKWRLISYNTTLPFVCYDNQTAPEKVHKKVIKLKLELENCSMNLKDSATRANLLRQLQDRLKESGVTLRWREQPDGVVFHKDEKKRAIKNPSCEL